MMHQPKREKKEKKIKDKKKKEDETYRGTKSKAAAPSIRPTNENTFSTE